VSEIIKKSERANRKQMILHNPHLKLRPRKLRKFTLLSLFNHLSHKNFSSSNIILKLLLQMTCGFQIRKIVHQKLKLWTWGKARRTIATNYFLLWKHQSERTTNVLLNMYQGMKRYKLQTSPKDLANKLLISRSYYKVICERVSLPAIVVTSEIKLKAK